MFTLNLNDMRASNVENLQPVAKAETAQSLLDFMTREIVEPYTTHGRWHKVFREGGPLEWFNTLSNLDEQIQDVGTREAWAEHSAWQYDMLMNSAPSV